MQAHNNGACIDFTQTKDTELIAVNEYLKDKKATATEVAVALNIYRPNLCRRKRTLEIAGVLYEVKKVRCSITKCIAWALTTNPDLIPSNSQLKLF